MNYDAENFFEVGGLWKVGRDTFSFHIFLFSGMKVKRGSGTESLYVQYLSNQGFIYLVAAILMSSAHWFRGWNVLSESSWEGRIMRID